MEIEFYVDAQGRVPFRRWLDRLDDQAAFRVRTALARLAQGHGGSLKPVGGGVTEARIDHGPGYRIYCGFLGSKLIVFLGGGTKARQQSDIETAQRRWADYKRRKQELQHGTD